MINKKIMIGTIIASILILSLPIVSSIEAGVTKKQDIDQDLEKCSICSDKLNLRPLCLLFKIYYNMYQVLHEYHHNLGNIVKAGIYKLWAQNMDNLLSLLNCPNAP